ncbi:MAG: hypothetical protein N2Z74_03465 [Syntrophales bacterium]|nr:hypothetical protein [Syntrophales bacterium]
MKLRQIAHSRTGDKGDTANVTLIAYDMAMYPLLEKYVTAERVKEILSDMVKGEVVCYPVPHLGVLNFVLNRALGGGVTRTLSLDLHGKSLSSAILEMEIPEM